tara:strand:- start:2323 stop:2493 length:171 start_codon:yes stop_codon:yes gene_type:complete
LVLQVIRFAFIHSLQTILSNSCGGSGGSGGDLGCRFIEGVGVLTGKTGAGTYGNLE